MNGIKQLIFSRGGKVYLVAFYVNGIKRMDITNTDQYFKYEGILDIDLNKLKFQSIE